jgi:membrane-bound ClpP family serine protease
MEPAVYTVCFFVGLLFTVASALFGHLLGGGHDVHSDVGTGGHAEAGFEDTGMPGFSPFSPTTICSFITAFGGFGMIFSNIEATRSTWISIPLSIFGALIVASAVFFVFNWVFRKTQASSEGHIVQMVGQNATVISPIPQQGVGEIAYVQGGSRYTAPARTESGGAVASGQTVKICRITGSQFYVSPV